MLDVGGVKVFSFSISAVTPSGLGYSLVSTNTIQVCTKLTFAIKNTIIFTIKYFGM